MTIATSSDTRASSSQVQLNPICGRWLIVQVYAGAFTFPAKATLPDGAANPYIVYGGPDLVVDNYYCIYDPVVELISPPDRTKEGYSISQKITGWSTIQPAGGQPPSAEFDAWPQSGSAPLSVSMHIVSTNNISSCLWEYGDGTTGTSCDPYHDHVYTSAGSYTVKLTVTGPGGSNTMTRSNYITVTAAAVCYTLTKSVNPSNSGSIIAFPIPNCADGKYAAGTQLSLVATSLSGYQFTSWGGSLSGNANPATLIMDADKNVTANFNQSSFCSAVTEIPQTECEALIAFYNSTNGAGWSDNSNWLDTTSPCNWYGVTCNNNHVVQLVLPNNQLNGSLPEQLNALTNLQTLSLYVNQLSGSIPPAVGSLANLISLSLSDNQLSGSIPASLGSLSNLQLLHAHGNQFSGNIPTQLGYLTNLRELDLAKNQLSGSIPTQIGNLTKLEKLGLGSNQFSGNIPLEIGKLTKLVGINLSNNQLSGNLPAQVGDLINLDFLSIENTPLSGALPGSLINLNKLVHFWFNNTNLCEPGDSSFQSWLTRISDLNRTGVACTIPPTITPTPEPSTTFMLSGKVAKWDGSNNNGPSVGIEIKVKGASGEYTTYTNQSGIFTLQVIRGTYQVTASSPNNVVYYQENNVDGLKENHVVQILNVEGDTTAKTFISIPCRSPVTELDICELKKGDILLKDANSKDDRYIAVVTSYFMHAAMYSGEGNLVEAYGSICSREENCNRSGEVRNIAIQENEFYKGTEIRDWVVLRVKQEYQNKIEGAVTYALQKAYDPNVRFIGGTQSYISLNNKIQDKEYYCSLLIWRSYKEQGLDLDRNDIKLTWPFSTWIPQVLPDDIYSSHYGILNSLTDVVYVKPGMSSVKRMLYTMWSPAHIKVTNDQGKEVGYDSNTGLVVNTIPGAYYSGFDTEPEWIRLAAWGDSEVEVDGIAIGSYALAITAIDETTSSSAVFQGKTQPGQKDIFSVKHMTGAIQIIPVVTTHQLYLPLIQK